MIIENKRKAARDQLIISRADRVAIKRRNIPNSKKPKTRLPGERTRHAHNNT